MFVEVVRPGRSTRGGDAKPQLRIEESRSSFRAALQLLCLVKIRASISPSDGQWLLVCTNEKKYPFFQKLGNCSLKFIFLF
jgi:hypothetical protein